MCSGRWGPHCSVAPAVRIAVSTHASESSLFELLAENTLLPLAGNCLTGTVPRCGFRELRTPETGFPRTHLLGRWVNEGR